MEAGAPLRARAGAEPGALGWRSFSGFRPSRNLLHGHDWILPYTGLVLAPVMLFPPRCFLSVFSYVLASPGSGRGQGRCGGPAAFLLGTVGLFFFSSAVGSCSDPRTGWKSPFGAQEPEEASLPLLFWYLFCCHFRSHSCSENIVADTQQDDLLAVIHRESSQTGFFPLMINLHVKFETQRNCHSLSCLML